MENELIKSTQPTPNILLQMAIERGVDISQLKELMDLQERWEAKQAKKSFLEALSKFQTLVPVINKSKTAKITSDKGGFSYDYAPLGMITQTIKTALNKCGLSYRWEFKEDNSKMHVTCLVSHLEGHTESTSMEGGPDSSGAKNGIQQKGSTHTYLQRYTLIGALGLSTADRDNDAATPKVKPLTEKEWKNIVSQVKTRSELSALFDKHKTEVESNSKVKSFFKEKQSELKEGERIALLISDATSIEDLDKIFEHVADSQMEIYLEKKAKLSK